MSSIRYKLGGIMKRLLAVFLCLGLCGCASYQYREIYNNALRAGVGITVIKEENYQKLQKEIIGYFEARDYQKVIFEDRKKGLIVFAKEGTFGRSCQIILKYIQKAGTDKIRVDIVKGSDELVTDDEVVRDMLQIAEQIKNE